MDPPQHREREFHFDADDEQSSSSDSSFVDLESGNDSSSGTEDEDDDFAAFLDNASLSDYTGASSSGSEGNADELSELGGTPFVVLFQKQREAAAATSVQRLFRRRARERAAVAAASGRTPQIATRSTVAPTINAELQVKRERKRKTKPSASCVQPTDAAPVQKHKSKRRHTGHIGWPFQLVSPFRRALLAFVVCILFTFTRYFLSVSARQTWIALSHGV